MKKLLIFSVLTVLVEATLVSARGGHPIYEPYQVTAVAGCGSNIGSTDGPPDQAKFFNPQGTAVDKEGNVYVVEQGNHAVRKITPDGVVSTFAGVADESGSADGKGSGHASTLRAESSSAPTGIFMSPIPTTVPSASSAGTRLFVLWPA